jgi:2,5-dihydroxypyridine 5,6-dioxygenase
LSQVNLDFDVSAAARMLARDVARITRGQEVLIYADSDSDPVAVSETAKAVHNEGAKVAVFWYPSPPGVGETTTQYLPASLAAAMLKADLLIEFAGHYLLYSIPWEEAMKTQRIKYLCLSGMTRDMMVRCIGKVDVPSLFQFQEKLTELARKAKKVRVSNPSGTDITFSNDPVRPYFSEGIIGDRPMDYMLIGQVDWAPVEQSLNGKIVFDGSVWPPEELGILRAPISLKIVNGVVKEIAGGPDAFYYRRWLESLNDSAMFNVAHVSFGCNPGAKLTGRILEDERIWGCIQWGLGHQGSGFKGKAGPAKSHTDGICLNASVWFDDKELLKDGSFVQQDLRELEKKLKR